jgi:beta-glucanase (GH16 family)
MDREDGSLSATKALRGAMLGAAAVLVALGAFASSARAQTATFTPVADSFVDSSYPSSTFGTESTLKVDASPAVHSYLRFNVQLPPGATITAATLKLYTTYESTTRGFYVARVSSNSWSEASLSYDNAPALGPQLGSSGSWSAPGYKGVRLPVSAVAAGLNSFGVGTTSSYSKSFHSREGANRPKLIVSYRVPSCSYTCKLVFSDDFNGTALDGTKWGTYSGQPGGDPGGFWDGSHCSVKNGVWSLKTYRDPAFANRWVSCGASSSYALKQAYGRYQIRMRMDAGKGVAGSALLVPVADVWPPEINFWQNRGSTTTRDSASATLHHGPNDSQIQRSLSGVDFTKWHTVGVRWTPHKLIYTLDGSAWATINNVNVPSLPMEMDVQTQAGTCGDQLTPCPDSTTPAHVNMQVDWVRAYSYRPPSTCRFTCKPVLSDDFNGTALDLTKWYEPYDSPSHHWAPNHAYVSGGALTIDAYQDPAHPDGYYWSTGVNNGKGLKQTYGKYEMRFRFDAGKGISDALMVFPSGDCWPPEIDFAESEGESNTTRTTHSGFLHYPLDPGLCHGGDANDGRIDAGSATADFTQWHTMGVEWTPGRLVYTLDGAPWSTINDIRVPNGPAEFVIQTQDFCAIGSGSCYGLTAPDSGTPAHVKLQVDWVHAYSYTL